MKYFKYWIPAAICVAISLVFYYGMVGYGFSALVFAMLAALIVFFGILRIIEDRGRAPRFVRFLRRFSLCCIMLGLVVIIIMEALIISGAKTDAGDVEYIIILGAGLNGTTPSISLTDRLEAALDYMLENPDCIAVASGGRGEGEDITEAEAMRRWLVARGIEEDRILLEERSTSTVKNIRYSLDVISKYADPRYASIAIVTSEYHLYRAKLIAAEEGVSVSGIAGETSIPLLKVNYYSREAFALLEQMVFG